MKKRLFIGATADSAFLRYLIDQKLDEIMAAKKKIRQAKNFITQAKEELQRRNEDVDS